MSAIASFVRESGIFLGSSCAFAAAEASDSRTIAHFNADRVEEGMTEL
jgi:hypothetical protein